MPCINCIWKFKKLHDKHSLYCIENRLSGTEDRGSKASEEAFTITSARDGEPEWEQKRWWPVGLLWMFSFEWKASETCRWIGCGVWEWQRSREWQSFYSEQMEGWSYHYLRQEGLQEDQVCVCVRGGGYLNLRCERVRFNMLPRHLSADMGCRRQPVWSY